MKTALRVSASMLYGLALYGALVFIPAGTLHYWQGWVFVAIAMGMTIASTVLLAVANPAALQRRMRGGPRAEKRAVQKILVTGVFLSAIAVMAFSAFDHRMRWSTVPAWVCVIGDVLVALGLGFASLVVIQNAYAAATITVEEGQTLATDGVYKVVRHPMYAGAIVMMLGTALALGSYWGLLIVAFGVLVFVLRIRDEENLLNQELRGYRDYTQQVPYRLVPHIW
ncbi:methyltransferase family protein [Mycobacterium vicinigordonae]|uniref:Isoprenylcysteine carboxylmethyltransferase family protein n=1 Tax=Mycobacterium vicinigordonae TaxID=1719132 RepID=A0A7D6E3V6_9MYCO|nr:isoprenylcysteine carboxylmethyltransferase family protein [Mycobacterium vicinigordonae]QLL06283.1 isoprenylcysteine carboxylmethyltransferase family protein [Mycobacterium vicinigordonae]